MDNKILIVWLTIIAYNMKEVFILDALNNGYNNSFNPLWLFEKLSFKTKQSEIFAFSWKSN